MTKPWVVYSRNTFYYSSESQKSKIKMLEGFHFFSKLLEESFLPLAASARPRSPLPVASFHLLCLHRAFPLCGCVLLCLLKIPALEFRAQADSPDVLILKSLLHLKALFQIRLHSQVLEVEMGL